MSYLDRLTTIALDGMDKIGHAAKEMIRKKDEQIATLKFQRFTLILIVVVLLLFILTN